MYPHLFRRALAPAFVALSLLAGCTSATPAAQPVAAVAAVAAPTPLIIYVTPAPAAAETTPDPTVAPTAEPTAKPTAKPTPKPTAAPSYKQLSARGWKLLVKSPDSYMGRTYQVWACIFQFDAATGDDAFLAFASYHKEEYWASYGETASFTGSAGRLADFVEDDMVVMNVVAGGSYSYDTQAGGNTTVPVFEIVKITHKGSCE